MWTNFWLCVWTTAEVLKTGLLPSDGRRTSFQSPCSCSIIVQRFNDTSTEHLLSMDQRLWKTQWAPLFRLYSFRFHPAHLFVLLGICHALLYISAIGLFYTTLRMSFHSGWWYNPLFVDGWMTDSFTSNPTPPPFYGGSLNCHSESLRRGSFYFINPWCVYIHACIGILRRLRPIFISWGAESFIKHSWWFWSASVDFPCGLSHLYPSHDLERWDHEICLRCISHWTHYGGVSSTRHPPAIPHIPEVDLPQVHPCCIIGDYDEKLAQEAVRGHEAERQAAKVGSACKMTHDAKARLERDNRAGEKLVD